MSVTFFKKVSFVFLQFTGVPPRVHSIATFSGKQKVSETCSNRAVKKPYNCRISVSRSKNPCELLGVSEFSVSNGSGLISFFPKGENLFFIRRL